MSTDDSNSSSSISNSSTASGGRQFSISALLLSVLAMFGVVALPGKSSPPAPRSTPASAPVAADGDTDSPIDDPKVGVGEKLVQQHRAARCDDYLLPMLEVLDRFQAPRMAQRPDQGQALLSSRKDHVDYLLSGANHQDRITFLVALVPDPIRSGSAYRYDLAMNSMLLAFRRNGYVLDSYDLDHWHRARSGPPVERPNKRNASGASVYNSADDGDLRGPGVVLLRRSVPVNPPESKAPTHSDPAVPRPDSNDLVVLLLVAETPVRGVHSVMLHNSLDIVRRAWSLQQDKQPIPIRMIGPNFTGSAPSLVRSLSAWLKDFKNDPSEEKSSPVPGKPLISWINGVAMAINHVQLKAQFDAVLPDAVTFRATTDSQQDLSLALLGYLAANKPWVGGDGLAYFTEETTGFGEAASQRIETGPDHSEARSTPESGFSIYRYTFPAHISEIRRRYQSLSQSDGSTVHLGDQEMKVKPSERLQFSDIGADTPEFLVAEAPAMMAAYDELRLLRMAQDINRRGIRFAVFNATDVRDYLFLASFFREHCPNVQLATLANDEALTHHEHILSLRGTIVASTYPLWLGNQDANWSPVPGSTGWESGKQGQDLPRDLRIHTFPTNLSFACYNATLVHLIETEPDRKKSQFLKDGLVSASWPGKDQADTVSPIWLTTVGYKGFEPLAYFRPPLGSTDSNPDGNSFRNQGRLAMGEARLPLGQQNPATPFERQVVWARYFRWTSGTTPLLPWALWVAALVFFGMAFHRGHEIHDKLKNGWPMGEPEERQIRDSEWVAEHQLADRKDDFVSGPLEWIKGICVLLLLLLAPLGLIFLVGPQIAGLQGHTFEGFLDWLSRPLLHSTLVFWMVAIFLTSRLRHHPRMPRILGSIRMLRSRHEPGSKHAQKKMQMFLLLLLILLVQVSLFVILRISTLEPASFWVQPPLLGTLLVLFTLLLLETAWLLELWRRYQRFSQTLLTLPLGAAIDRLPRTMTARFGDYLQAIMGEDDSEQNPKIQQFRRLLETSIHQHQAEPAPPGPAEQAKQALERLCVNRAGKPALTNLELCRGLVPALRPLWHGQELQEAEIATVPQAPVEHAPAPVPSIHEKTFRLAEDFLTFHLLRHADRVLDLIWNIMTLVMVSALLLMAACNSYPFQPARILSDWMMVVVSVVTVAIVTVLVGIQKDELMARVKKTGSSGSLWNLEFGSRLITYVAPVLALLATLMYGFYDTLLVILGPFMH